MTDRIHSITVVLKENIRVDDAESLIEALKHFRGVIAVDGNVADFESHMAEERARSKFQTILFDALRRPEK